MIGLDEALREHAAQWRRDEAAPPDLDRALVRVPTGGSRRRWPLMIAVAACVLALATVAVVLGERNGSHPAAVAGPTFKSHPLPHSAPPATELARLRGIARSIADQYADKGAVTAEAVATAGDLAWLMEVHGHFECIGCTGPFPPGHVLTVKVGTTGGSVLSLGDNPRELGKLGTVISLGTIPPKQYPDAIVHLAMVTAHNNGDAHATAQAVRTTFVKAEHASSSDTDNTPDRAVWLVQLEGAFVCTSCRYPYGAKPPSGRFITLIVDAVSPYKTSSFGIGNRTADLAKLGTVVTLLP